MIKYHPEQSQLTQFVQGNISPAEALIVSAHCDLCHRCRQFVQHQTQLIAAEVFDTPQPKDSLENYGAMLAAITQLPASETAPAAPDNKLNLSTPEPIATSTLVKTLELDGHQFTLPPTLQRIAAKTGNWSGLVGRLWQAPVELNYPGVANFIYMGRGGSVPEHTHRGVEYTLVLDGEFNDGINHYRTGDFVVMTDDNTHAPHSEHREGCLVFTLLDEPLHFSSGIARLLNPFSHLFFR